MTGSLALNERRLYEDAGIGLDKYGKGADDRLLVNILKNYRRNEIHDYNVHDYLEARTTRDPFEEGAEYEKDPLKGLLEILGSTIAYKTLRKLFPEPPEDSMDKLSYALYALFNRSIGTPLRTFTYGKLRNEFPTLSHEIGYILGPSKIGKYYVAEYTDPVSGETERKPLYIQIEGGKDPAKEDLKKLFETLIKDPKRYGDGLNVKLREDGFDDRFTLTRADLDYTRGDIKEVEDIHYIWRKFSRKGLFLCQQHGKEEIVDIGIPSVVVKKYSKPPGFIKYPFFKSGDILYDITDMIGWRFLTTLFGRGIARQVPVEKELDAHNALHHAIWPTPRPMLPHYT